MFYDIIIIGADAAGLTAGIYAGRKKMNAIILTKKVGGQTFYSSNIENYPGFSSIFGVELISKMRGQVEKFGVPIEEDAEVVSVEKEGDDFSVLANGKKYRARSVLIASGKKQRLLGVKGEEEFLGKGVSVCAICDAPFYQDKNVAVVGGGDSAMESVYDLLKYAGKIYIINHSEKFKGDEAVFEKIKENSKVQIITNGETREIKGAKFVESIVYDDLSAKGAAPDIALRSQGGRGTGETKELKVAGVFVNIGHIPNSGFVKNLVKLNGLKEIVVDPKTNFTSVPGIFAAGDVTDIKYKQFVIAAAEGAKALLSVAEYLKAR